MSLSDAILMIQIIEQYRCNGPCYEVIPFSCSDEDSSITAVFYILVLHISFLKASHFNTTFFYSKIIK